MGHSSGRIVDLNRSKMTLWLSGSLVSLALLLAACGSTGPSRSNGPTAARSAIKIYEAANGPTAGSWKITSLQTSSVDPAYVLFRIGSTPRHEIQGGYGFAYEVRHLGSRRLWLGRSGMPTWGIEQRRHPDGRPERVQSLLPDAGLVIRPAGPAGAAGARCSERSDGSTGCRPSVPTHSRSTRWSAPPRRWV